MRFAVIAVIAVLLAPAAASARPGDLDRSFGPDRRGFVEYKFDSDESAATDVAVRRDGSIVAVGTTRQFGSAGAVDRIAVVILRPDGRRRAVNQVGFSPGAPHTRGLAVGVQPSGRIIVVGEGGGALGERYIAIARLTAGGRLDRSFGDGGRVLLPLGSSSGPAGAMAGVHGAALDAQGRIVVAGLSGGRRFVRRFLTDGLLDADFGDAGLVTEPALPRAGDVVSVAIDARGRVLLGGYDQGRERLALVRLSDDGAVDAGFGTGGRAEVEVASDTSTPGSRGADLLALPGRGGYVVATNSRGRFVVVRFTPGGRLQRRFGTRGVTRLGSRVYTNAGLVRQPDGKLVLAGAAYVRTVLARLTRAGRPDRSFGRGGVTVRGFGDHDGTQPNGIAIQRRRRLIVAGEDSLDERIDYSTYFAIARFRL